MTAPPPLRHIAVIFAQSLLVPVTVAVAMALPAAAQGAASTKNVHPDNLRDRAAKGDVQAMWVLQQRAVWYKNPKKTKAPDQRIEFSQEERLKWIRAGVAAGDPYSMEKMARILGKGRSGSGNAEDDFTALVTIDYAESARLARAAAAGFRQHKAEFRYSGIDGGEKLEARAEAQKTFAQQSDDLSVLLPLAETGDKEAIWGVYLVHSVAGNYPDIWDWLAVSRKAGDPRATVETWRRSTWTTNYKAWENGKPDEWLIRAARLGDADAMNSMGNAFAWYTDDHASAHDWYQKAHAAGSPLAEVGMHLYGDATALRHFKAAEAGDGHAAYQLAQYYVTGAWDGRNTGEHERWMRKAVDWRHTEAQWEWGMRTGNENLIRAAANAGHAEAQAEVVAMNIEARRWESEQAAEARRQAEAIYTSLRTRNNYDKSWITEEQLYFALQAAQSETERDLVQAESARRVSAYIAASNAGSGYRPMSVTPYVSQPSYKSESDYRMEHREYKEQIIARIRNVVR